jgi:hypothetical protein
LRRRFIESTTWTIFPIPQRHPLDIPAQRPHHADPCMHQEVAAFGGTDQATDRRLPFREVLLQDRRGELTPPVEKFPVRVHLSDGRGAEPSIVACRLPSLIYFVDHTYISSTSSEISLAFSGV